MIPMLSTRQRRERDTLAPKPHAGGRQPRLAEYDAALRAAEGEADTTLAELREALGLKVQLSTLWYRLNHLGLTFKKTLRAAEQAREDVRLARDAWHAEPPTLAPAKLVFVDETFATTAMNRLYGWGPNGERVIGTIPQGHWQTTTFVAA
jgi:hypothetical protein